MQVIAWIFLYVATKMHVEDATSDTYKLQEYNSEIAYGQLGGYSRHMIAEAVADRYGTDFLWMDYDIEHVPAVVTHEYYEIITTVGLVFSIIEFVIGFIVIWYIKDFDEKNVKEMNECGSKNAEP